MIKEILRLAGFGFIVWLIVIYIPMVEPIKRVIIAVAAIVLIIWVMAMFGIVDLPVPKF